MSASTLLISPLCVWTCQEERLICRITWWSRYSKNYKATDNADCTFCEKHISYFDIELEHSMPILLKINWGNQCRIRTFDQDSTRRVTAIYYWIRIFDGHCQIPKRKYVAEGVTIATPPPCQFQSHFTLNWIKRAATSRVWFEKWQREHVGSIFFYPRGDHTFAPWRIWRFKKYNCTIPR